jgi:glutamine amidotransferase
MSGPDTIVVRTGTANLASVLAALKRLGVPARTSNDPRDVAQADRLILPGVGAFAAAMTCLQNDGLVGPLKQRIDAGKPTLGICLGMQLLFDASDESPGCPGLGVAPGQIHRFTEEVRIPQMGWNHLVAGPSCDLLQTGYAYFANSYRASDVPAGWSAAIADHGGSFVAAMERGPILACQFHPELSGRFGLDLIQRWLDLGERSC